MQRWLVAILITVAGCGDDGAKDASVDIDNGSCGDQLRFTGELVDWDNHTAFCGVKGATVEVPNGAMSVTAPNGRFDLCLPGTDKFTTLPITFSAMTSECTTPMSNYSMPTVIYADHGVIKAGGFYSARAMTAARTPTFFQLLGISADPTKGHVLVHVSGGQAPITLSGDHGAPFVTTATGWAAGEEGTDIFFPNVAPGMVKLSSEDRIVGGTTIPVTAGTVTNVGVLFVTGGA